jgi:hypothetical protein
MKSASGVLLLLHCAALVAGCSSPAPAPDPAKVSAKVSKAAGTERVCKVERPIGSHVYEQVCRDTGQVAQNERDAQDLFTEARRKYPTMRR